MKIFISLICWLFSGLALYYSGIAIMYAISPPSWAFEGTQPLDIIKAVSMSYAWIALFIMNFAWVNNFKLGKFWPISGTIVGSVVIADVSKLNVTMLLFVASAFLLAVYLVYFHLFASSSRNECNKKIKERFTD